VTLKSTGAAPKAPTAPKSAGVASSKATSSHTKFVSRVGDASGASVPPKAGAPAKAVVSISVVTQAVPKVEVLGISTGLK
jgi:hypothetical protein